MSKDTKTFGSIGQEFIYWAQFGRPAPLAKTTLETHKRTLALVNKSFGIIPIEMISLETVTNLRKDMMDRGSQLGYIIKVMMFVRTVLRYAGEELELNVLSWQRIKIPPRPRPDVKYLSQGELDRVLAEIPTDTLHGIRTKALLTTLLDTGMRISEALSLNRNSIDIEDQSAFIIGKGNKKRKVLFQDWSLWWIKQYLALRRDDNEAMFIAHQPGYPLVRLKSKDVQRAFNRIAKLTGIEKFTPHMARKTAGSTMWNNGADIQDVQVFLGHERLQTTQIYVGKNYERVRSVQHQTLNYRAASDTGITAVIRWSKLYDKCVSCEKIDKPHAGKGYCYNCYMNLKNAKKREEHMKTLGNTVPVSH